MNRLYDVIIVGGGVMGCSTAYQLTAADPGLRVAVVERDPSYEFASTPRSLANVRIQFSLQENVQVSQYASDVLERFEEEMALNGEQPALRYRREGNLFLVAEGGEPEARAALALQKSLGCEVDWWSPEAIQERFPLYRVQGFAGATFGPRDGHVDAHALLMGYRAKALQQGAVFLQAEVAEVVTAGGRAEGVRVASGDTLSSGIVVNCAGAWAARVAATAGVELPIQPVQRQVFVLDTEVKPAAPLPLTILRSGLYFRSEGDDLIVIGKSLTEDPVGFDFDYDRNRFLEMLWPELAEFVPAFEALRLVRGWAGLYAVNVLDGNAILGEWPDLPGLFLANGFSGHGLQQAPAVGRYLAELILHRPHALDLTAFGPERILEGKPLCEGGLV